MVHGLSRVLSGIRRRKIVPIGTVGQLCALLVCPSADVQSSAVPYPDQTKINGRGERLRKSTSEFTIVVHSHAVRAARDLMYGSNTRLVTQSIDTIRLFLVLSVDEKSLLELCRKLTKLTLPVNFKVQYFKNETDIQKSGVTDFRYCPT